jgi:hypothetical protein
MEDLEKQIGPTTLDALEEFEREVSKVGGVSEVMV